MKRTVFATILVASIQLAAQTSSSPATPSNPKVRAITGFVQLDKETCRKRLAQALVVPRQAKADFESAGYDVETLRVTTQPLAELVVGMSEDQALAFSGPNWIRSRPKRVFFPTLDLPCCTKVMIGRRCTCWRGHCRLCQTSKPAPSSPCQTSGRWCVAPCSRFQGGEIEPSAGGSLADQIARSRSALTADQLAESLSLSVVTIFKLARRGIIPAVRMGSSVRFCGAAIAKWLKERGG